MALKILHTADLHMDSPFAALSAGKAATRRGELRELPGRIARLAVREKADMLLLAGDLLDSDSFFCETAEELFRVLRNLPLPVFIAPGNHDYYTLHSPYARADLPGNVYVFTKNEIEYFDFSDYGFRVFGGAFTDRSSGPLLRKFRTEKKPGVLDILCLHGEITSSGADAENGKYDPITLRQLADSGMDYVGLGHTHQSSGLQRVGKTWYSVPGCPEGRGFDETGEKTVNLVELSEEGCTLKALPVSDRKYESLTVDITGREPLLTVQMELPEETVRDIYRIVLTGETDAPVDTAKLYRGLSQNFFELVIRDETHIRPELWACAGEDTLRGLFLARMRRQFDRARDEEDRREIEQAVRWGLAALDNREEVIRHENQ